MKNVCNDAQLIFASQFFALYWKGNERMEPVACFSEYPFASYEKFKQINKAMGIILKASDELNGFKERDLEKTLLDIQRKRLFKSDQTEIIQSVDTINEEEDIMNSKNKIWCAAFENAMVPSAVSSEYIHSHSSKGKQEWKKLVCGTETYDMSEVEFETLWESCDAYAQGNYGSSPGDTKRFYLLRQIRKKQFNDLNKKLNRHGACLHIRQALDYLFDLTATDSSEVAEIRIFESYADIYSDIKKRHKRKPLRNINEIMSLRLQYRLAKNPQMKLNSSEFEAEMKKIAFIEG